MKNIKEILTEGKKTFAGFNDDDIKCIFGALVFIDNSENKRDEFCEILNIDPNLFYQLEQEFSKNVGNAAKIENKIAELGNRS